MIILERKAGMFPIINKKETGVNLRRIMDRKGVTAKDVQQYLGLGCVQSIYRWFNGQSMPTIDNLYALSELLGVPIDMLVCGNRKSRELDTHLVAHSVREQRLYIYYEKMNRLNVA